MDGRVANENVFKARLNELYAAKDNRLTNRMVVEGIAAQGVRISEAYLSQLRTGVRERPSGEIVLAIADFFEVTTDYFYRVPWSDDRSHAEKADADIINDLSASAIKNLLMASNGLSAISIELLVEMTVKLGVADGAIAPAR